MRNASQATYYEQGKTILNKKNGKKMLNNYPSLFKGITQMLKITCGRKQTSQYHEKQPNNIRLNIMGKLYIIGN